MLFKFCFGCLDYFRVKGTLNILTMCTAQVQTDTAYIPEYKQYLQNTPGMQLNQSLLVLCIT